MPLDSGTTLGPYSVATKIGEGGKGEMYRARDTKLDRDVALKVLPQAFPDDPGASSARPESLGAIAQIGSPLVTSLALRWRLRRDTSGR